MYLRTHRVRAALIVLVACVACKRSKAQESLQITMAKPSIALAVGDTATVRAVVTVASQEAPVTLTWSSDNDAVASVNRSGRVTALAPGVTGITARIGTAFASTRVSVSPVTAQREPPAASPKMVEATVTVQKQPAVHAPVAHAPTPPPTHTPATANAKPPGTVATPRATP
ncbi:MAG: Ig-like domain-containing protein, partial [Gemmatimonadaceae bacterium]